jgi:large subunit ribosomal protein L19
MVGIVISKVNRGLGTSFTIRNAIEGFAFEMEFQSYNPLIESVEVLQLTRRRRAKLNYLRER